MKSFISWGNSTWIHTWGQCWIWQFRIKKTFPASSDVRFSTVTLPVYLSTRCCLTCQLFVTFSCLKLPATVCSASHSSACYFTLFAFSLLSCLWLSSNQIALKTFVTWQTWFSPHHVRSLCSVHCFLSMSSDCTCFFIYCPVLIKSLTRNIHCLTCGVFLVLCICESTPNLLHKLFREDVRLFS